MLFRSIRDIDDDVYARLVRHAAQAGLTVPELLRREANRVAGRPTIDALRVVLTRRLV